MTNKKPFKVEKVKKIETESLMKKEESLCDYKNLDKTNIKKDGTKGSEWKHITDFYPKRKRLNIRIKDRLIHMYRGLINWIKKDECRLLANKVALKYASIIAVTILLVGLMLQLKIRPVVVVSLDKTSIAVVPDKKSFETILSKLQTNWKNAYKKDIRIKGVLSYKTRLLPSKAIDTPKEVAQAIEAHTDSLIKAKAITVNGETKAVIKDEGAANTVLNTIKSKFASNNIKDAQFSEDVKIVDIYVMQEIIKNEKDAVGLLLTSVDTINEYTVKQGDTLWDIADNNHISITKLAELNPNVGDNLKLGQIIRLAAPKSIINVKTTEITQITENTPYETKFQSDSNIAKGQRKVVAYGTSGRKSYKVQVIKQNGVEISRNILSEKVIQESKTEVIAIGTKVTKTNVAKAITGSFRVPAFGSITSRFGYRWGRVHEGIDISGSTGQPIYAADGGTVIFSGVESGYGNFIKISHGNGLVSCYGHCSKLLIRVGQKVSKGDKIALVGNTGHSTGSHLHFEVRKNGTPVDPLKYLK